MHPACITPTAMPANKDKNRAGASASAASAPAASDFPAGAKLSWDDWLALFRGSVSYTHLTLPTKRIV